MSAIPPRHSRMAERSSSTIPSGMTSIKPGAHASRALTKRLFWITEELPDVD
jgi:hypothetical protein